jgi:hypothetical protein
MISEQDQFEPVKLLVLYVMRRRRRGFKFSLFNVAKECI